jgi:hypothetical protein
MSLGGFKDDDDYSDSHPKYLLEQSSYETFDDKSPNLELIATLSRMLEDAGTGRLRSLIYIKAENDNRTVYSACVDPRSNKARLHAAVATCSADIAMYTALHGEEGLDYLFNRYPTPKKEK